MKKQFSINEYTFVFQRYANEVALSMGNNLLFDLNKKLMNKCSEGKGHNIHHKYSTFALQLTIFDKIHLWIS